MGEVIEAEQSMCLGRTDSCVHLLVQASDLSGLGHHKQTFRGAGQIVLFSYVDYYEFL